MEGARSMLAAILKTMRPKQWTENVFMSACLVFDKKLLNSEYATRTVTAFVLFCTMLRNPFPGFC